MSKNKKNKSFSLKEKLNSSNMNNNWYDFFKNCLIYLLVIFITALLACNLIFLIHIPKEVVLPTNVCSYPYTEEKRYGVKDTSPIYNLMEPTDIDQKDSFVPCEPPYKINESNPYLQKMYDKLKYKNQSLFYSFLQNLYRGGYAFKDYLNGYEAIPLQHSAWHMRAFMMVHVNFRKYLGGLFDMLYSFSDSDSYCKTVLFIISFLLVFSIHFLGFGFLLIGLVYMFATVLYMAEMILGGSPGIFFAGLTPVGFLLTWLTVLATVGSVTISALWLYYKCLLVAPSRKVIFCLLKNNGYIITLLFGMAIVFSAFQHLNKFSAITMLIAFLIVGFKTLMLHFERCGKDIIGYKCDSKEFFDSIEKIRKQNEYVDNE